MSEKISLVLDTVVKGTEDILSTTTATERLTKAIADQRDEIKKVNSDLKKVEGYQSAIKSMKRLRQQYKNAESDVERLSKEQQEHREHTRKLSAAYKETEKEVASLNTRLNSASGDGVQKIQNQIDSAKNRLTSLNHQMSEGKVRTSELNQAYKQATKRVSTLSDKQIKQTDKLRDLGSQLKRAGVDTKRLSDAQQKLEKQSKEATAAIAKQNEHLQRRKAITDRIDNRNAKLSELGGDATSLAIQAAPIGASVWSAVKNESSFADVKKVVDMSPEEAAQLRSWALRTSASKDGGGLSGNDINAMLAAGGQSGVQDLSELKSFVLDSAAMGVAFDMEAGQAGETLATFKAALGLDQKGAVGLAGAANYLSNNMNAKAGAIASVMAREGASAQMAGFSVNEAAALSASMLATGMSDERASTALKLISGNLTKGSSATKSQSDAFAKIGFDPEDLAAMMQDDASGAFLEVLAAIKDAPLEEQGALISQIFGEEAKGAVSKLAGNTALYTDALKYANEEQSVHIGSLQNEFASRISTTENGLETFINKVTRLSVIFGNSLLPALNWVLEPLGDAAMMIGDFAEANETLTSAVAIGVTGFVALKGALLAGKAASLIFGNSIDKGKLFRNGLERETTANGKAAQFATQQIRRMNDALYEVGGGRGRPRNIGKDASSRSRRRRPRTRRRGLVGQVMNLSSTVFSGRKGAIPLSMAGGGLAMMPAMAAAQDVIDIGGDLAEGAGKAGLSKLLRPLSMAISAGNIASAIAGGDTKEAITEGGGLLGGLGGASLGAALGTAIFPGVGTVVGGLLGSLGGDYFGSAIAGWIGDGVTSEPKNKLMQPEEVEMRLADKRQKEAALRTMPPVKVDAPIQIHAAPGMDAQQIALEVKRQLEESLQMAGLTVEESLSVSYIDA